MLRRSLSSSSKSIQLKSIYKFYLCMMKIFHFVLFDLFPFHRETFSSFEILYTIFFFSSRTWSWNNERKKNSIEQEVQWRFNLCSNFSIHVEIMREYEHALTSICSSEDKICSSTLFANRSFFCCYCCCSSPLSFPSITGYSSMCAQLYHQLLQNIK